MLPHHPCCEQQLPNVDPWHVKPEVPPQVPSVETLTLAGADEVAALDEVAAGVGVAALVTELATLLEPQLPAPAWQPVPQYAPVEPQYPAEEQQLPKVDPKQVLQDVRIGRPNM